MVILNKYYSKVIMVLASHQPSGSMNFSNFSGNKSSDWSRKDVYLTVFFFSGVVVAKNTMGATIMSLGAISNNLRQPNRFRGPNMGQIFVRSFKRNFRRGVGPLGLGMMATSLSFSIADHYLTNWYQRKKSSEMNNRRN